MTLRLSGDSGFTEIKAPNAAGDNSITLPTSNGGANQLLQNGTTAGTLEFTSAAGGLHYDSSGRLLVNTSTNTGNYKLQVDSSVFTVAQFTRYVSDGATVVIGSSRGTQASKTALNDNDYAGLLDYKAHQGVELKTIARVSAQMEANAAVGDLPGRLSFWTTPTGDDSPQERVQIGSTGEIRLLTDCPGIDFSRIQTNNAGMVSETLDSYEEGVFLPTYIMTGVNGTMSQSFDFNHGEYVKIGKLCYFAIDMRLSSFSKGTGTGAVRIQGLPFIPAQTSNYKRATGFCYLYNWNYSATATDNPIFSVYQNLNQTWMDIGVQRLGNTGADVLDPGNSSMLFMSGCYKTKD